MRVFTEIQRLPKWIYIIIIPSFLLALFMIIHEYINASSAHEKEEVLFALLAVSFTEAFAVLLIVSIKQVVRIDKTGIYYKYPPFKTKEVHIPITKIKAYDLVNYTFPYYGYRVGGWNVLRRTPPAITMIGISKAVRITFRDDKALLIGTKTPDKLINTLHYIIQKNKQDEED